MDLSSITGQLSNYIDVRGVTSMVNKVKYAVQNLTEMEIKVHEATNNEPCTRYFAVLNALFSHLAVALIDQYGLDSIQGVQAPRLCRRLRLVSFLRFVDHPKTIPRSP